MSYVIYNRGTIKERIAMTVVIEYQPSEDYLTKIGNSIMFHSRFNHNHIKHCERCYEDHEDFVEQMRIDEIEDACNE